MQRHGIASTIVFLLVATACGGASFEFSIGGASVDEAAEALIEGELAEQLGAALDADCPPVADPGVGTEFACTATTPSGDIIGFSGLVDEEDHIDVSSTNVIRADRLDVWEVSGGEVVSELIDGPVDIDCGSEMIVLPASFEMTCTGTDQYGDEASIIYRITDLAAGDYDIRIGE